MINLRLTQRFDDLIKIFKQNINPREFKPNLNNRKLEKYFICQ